MALQEKWYTIKTLADLWGVPPEQIDNYLLIGKLKASIYIKPGITPLYKLEDDGIHFDRKAGVNGIVQVSGFFEIENYKNIHWDFPESDSRRADMKRANVKLRQDSSLYKVFTSYFITPFDIYITSKEVERFEPDRTNQPLGLKSESSLLKMVIVMAIDGYGYDPNQLKSPIPQQITDLMHEQGFKIDDDTVRKWLKKAAELLPPKGWTEE